MTTYSASVGLYLGLHQCSKLVLCVDKIMESYSEVMQEKIICHARLLILGDWRMTVGCVT